MSEVEDSDIDDGFLGSIEITGRESSGSVVLVFSVVVMFDEIGESPTSDANVSFTFASSSSVLMTALFSNDNVDSSFKSELVSSSVSFTKFAGVAATTISSVTGDVRFFFKEGDSSSYRENCCILVRNSSCAFLLSKAAVDG